MKSVSFLLLALLCSPASGQIPVIPATPAEQTRVPVFGDFKTGGPAQTFEHRDPLANFRLRMDYKVPQDGGLLLRLNAQKSLTLTTPLHLRTVAGRELDRVL